MFIDYKLIGSETSVLLGIKTCHHYKSCIHLESPLVHENQSHLVKWGTAQNENFFLFLVDSDKKLILLIVSKH